MTLNFIIDIILSSNCFHSMC